MDDTGKLNFRSALKLFFSFSVGIWVHAIISFFSVPIITYLISPEEFGKATMYSTLYSLLLVLVMAGADQSFMRSYYEVDEKKRAELLWTSLFTPVNLFILVSLFLIALSGKLSLLLLGESGHPIGLLVSVSLITGIFQTFNMTSIRMQKKGFLYSVVFIVQSVANVGGTIAYALLFGRNFYAIIWGQILANLISFLVGFAFEHAHLLPVRINFRLLKSIWSYGIPLLPSALMWWLFSWTSRISLRAFSTFTELGYYSTALRLSNVMYMICAGFQNFWFPVAYETYEKDRENRKFFSDAAHVISFVMIIFALLVIALRDLIFLIISKDYKPSASVLPFLLFSPVVLSILAVTARGINFTKKTYWFIVSDSACVILNLLGNYLLIPKFGARGAAVSTGISFIALFTIESFVSMKLFPVKYPILKIYSSLLFFIFSSSVATFVNNALVIYTVVIGSIVAVCAINADLLKVGIKEAKNVLKRWPPTSKMSK